MPKLFIIAKVAEAEMAKLVDALALGASSERIGGSSPPFGTKCL